LFETVFHQLLADCKKRLGVAKTSAKLGLPGKLLSLDATVIDLCAAGFDWAPFPSRKTCRHTGLHPVHFSLLPSVPFLLVPGLQRAEHTTVFGLLFEFFQDGIR
jgi:hypothetical protein